MIPPLFLIMLTSIPLIGPNSVTSFPLWLFGLSPHGTNILIPLLGSNFQAKVQTAKGFWPTIAAAWVPKDGGTSRSISDVLRRVTGPGSVQTLRHHSDHSHNVIKRITRPMPVLMSSYVKTTSPNHIPANHACPTAQAGLSPTGSLG